MKISILTPTRNRAENLTRMAKSAVNTSSGSNDIQFLNYIDEDDPSIDFYKSEQNKLQFDDYVEFFNIISEHQSVSKSWNVLASEALARDCDILMMGNDDQVFKTQDWDSTLIDEIKILIIPYIVCGLMIKLTLKIIVHFQSYLKNGLKYLDISHLEYFILGITTHGYLMWRREQELQSLFLAL